MNPKRICSAVVVAVVMLAAFGCGAAEQAPAADAPPGGPPAATQSEPTALATGPEELAVEPTPATDETPSEPEVDGAESKGSGQVQEPTKPAKPEMVRKPIAWPVFKFDAGVPKSDREFIRRAVKTVQSYFVIARPKAPAVKAVVRGYWGGCPFDAFLAMGHSGGLEICVSLPGWRNMDAVLNWRVVAHEWFHVVEGNLAYLTWLSAGLSTVPAWFSEGSAEWMAWNAVAHFSGARQTYAQAMMRDWASGVSTPLQSMLTLEQLADASPGSSDSYGVAYWAVDYLGATPQKLLLLYRRIGEGMAFQQAAKKTFGRAIDSKFYRDFEAYRARGFYGS